MLKAIKEICEYHQALKSQFYVNIKTTVVATRLGILWWILDPLLLMIIYYFVVKVVFDRGGPDYHLFALCGIVTWQSFARSINLATSSIIRNAGLIKQATLPIFLYVIVAPIVQAFFYMIGVFIIVLWNYKVIGWQTFSIFFLIFLMIIMSVAAGLFLSIFEAFVRDTGKFVMYILRFGFFMSPVLYSPERIYDNPNIPEYAKILYSINPMVHFITAVRDVLFRGTMFDLFPIFLVFMGTIAMLQFGFLFFRKVSPYIPKII